jgi:hypothetical protein
VKRIHGTNGQRSLTALPTAALLALLIWASSLDAAAEPPQPRDFQAFRARALTNYQHAQSRWQKDQTNVDAAWKFGRASFDWAEFATNDAQRAAVAELGIAACRRAVRLRSNSVEAHYYLGLNIGQLARTKLLGALKLIDEMESSWSAAIQLDPKFDYAGPHRSIGVLYRDAPGWPTSIGSDKRARFHLQKAKELHPDYPGNRLALYEGLVQWGDKKTIRDQAEDAESFFQKARQSFTGDAWAWDWADWERRWADIKRKAGVNESGSK